MILVAGATGSLGGRIVRMLLERAEEVAGLVRKSSDHASLAEAGMAVRMGDLGEPETLERACQGVDLIVSTASATKRNDLPENVDGRGNINLIEAAKAAGVGRLSPSADPPPSRSWKWCRRMRTRSAERSPFVASSPAS